jgi:hypothetical protein
LRRGSFSKEILVMFRFSRRRAALNRALKSAVAGHRPLLLRELLTCHGEAEFATALSPNSGRVIADVLSMLPREERQRVACRLPKAARERNARAGGPALEKPVRQGLWTWKSLSPRAWGASGSGLASRRAMSIASSASTHEQITRHGAAR